MTFQNIAKQNMRFHRRSIMLLPSALMLGIFVFQSVPANATYGDTTTFLGKVYDGDGGQANQALLDFPEDIASDGSGNFYIADTFDNAIRKVDSSGIITTLAGGSYGSADGNSATASFAFPRGVAADSTGSVYVADTGNNAIRKISSSGDVTALVNSGLSSPQGIAINGSTLFILDTGNNALKSIPISGGTLTTIATGLSDPRKLAVTADGSTAYVANAGTFQVLKVILASGTVSVLAGSGTQGYVEGIGSSAQFDNPLGVGLSSDGTTLYVSDPDLYLTDRIRTINLATGTTALFASDTTQETMIFPAGMAVYNGSLYVAQSGLGTVHQWTMNASTTHSVFAGTSRFGSRDGADPLFGRPHDLTMTLDGKTFYLADNNHIRKIDRATKTATTVIGTIVDNYREGAPEAAGTENLDEARFSTIAGIAVNAANTALYVADRWNNRIRKIDIASSPPRSSLITGAGRTNSTGDTTNAYQEGAPCSQIVDRNDNLSIQNGCAYFQSPISMVIDPTEQFLFVADSGNNRIRRIKLADGTTSLIAGGDAGFADGIGVAAQFSTPWGITINDAGTVLYVADRGNHRIRSIDLATNTVTTLAGAGSAGYQEGIGKAAYFSYPEYLKMGADGKLYLTEAGSHRIRQIDPATGLTKLVSGSGDKGYADGFSTAAKFYNLEGLVADTANGMLFAVDSWNDILRQVDVVGTAPYASPAPTVSSSVPSDVDPRWATKTGLKVKITGTGFRYGAVVKFYTHKAVKTYVVSSTEIVAQLPLDLMKPGWYDITVTNVDGQYAIVENGIGLRDPKSGRDSLTGKVPDTYFSFSELKGFYAFDKTTRKGGVLASGNVSGDARDEVIVGSTSGQKSEVRVFSNDGTLRAQFSPYSENVGANIAVCDLNGDGQQEIVTAPGKGAKPLIRIFTGTGKAALSPSQFYALDKKFTGGARLACADFNADGKAEIAVAGGPGSNGAVFLYTAAGVRTAKFFPFGKSFRGGFVMAAGIFPQSTAFSLLLGSQSGKTRVGVYTAQGTTLLKPFFPFGKAYIGGASIATGDLNSDGQADIVVAPAGTMKPVVQTYSGTGTLRSQFLAYPKTFTGGVSIAVGDANGDDVDDIQTMPLSGFTPSLRLFTEKGRSL